MYQFADHGTRHGSVFWKGYEKDCLDLTECAVYVGYIAFVFEIGNTSDPPEYGRHVVAAAEIDCESGVFHYADTVVVGINLSYVIHTAVGRQERVFVLVVSHGDYYMAEDSETTVHNRFVADGEGVEAAWKYSCFL